MTSIGEKINDPLSSHNEEETSIDIECSNLSQQLNVATSGNNGKVNDTNYWIALDNLNNEEKEKAVKKFQKSMGAIIVSACGMVFIYLLCNGYI